MKQWMNWMMLAALGLGSGTAFGQHDHGHAHGAGAVAVSLNVQGAFGGSTASNDELEDLQGGAHDPLKNGFTFQQAELGVSGQAGENLSGQAFVVASDHGVELEEAYAILGGLPGGTEVKAGYFLTGFGLQNPSHPHAWNWVDQSVINSRIFGGEGGRAAGAQVSLFLPAGWHSELQLGAQDAGGDFMTSFLTGTRGHDHGHDHGEEEAHAHGIAAGVEADHDHDHEAEEDHDHDHADHDHDAMHELEEAGFESGVGGRLVVDRETDDFEDLVFTVRWINRFYLDRAWMTQVGVSGMQGPNFTGDGADTWLAGLDWVLHWQDPDAEGTKPFFRLETELIYRDLEAAAFELEMDDGHHLHLPEETLSDWGFYSQGIYGFGNAWAAGLRVEYATGDGESVGGRESDPFRADRIRISPLLTYQVNEAARIKLQYNYDDTDALEDGDAHTVWLALDVNLGAHAH